MRDFAITISLVGHVLHLLLVVVLSELLSGRSCGRRAPSGVRWHGKRSRQLEPRKKRVAGGRLALNAADHPANKAHNQTRKDHDQRGAGRGRYEAVGHKSQQGLLGAPSNNSRQKSGTRWRQTGWRQTGMCLSSLHMCHSITAPSEVNHLKRDENVMTRNVFPPC